MAIERGVMPVNPLEKTAFDAQFDDMEVDLEDDAFVPLLAEVPEAVEPVDFYENLAERMTVADLENISSDLIALVESDKDTMDEWEEIYEDGLKLLGFKITDVEQEVFPDSCTVTHPILAESIVKYQAKARSQILRPDGIARAKTVGRITDEKRAQAERVTEFLNWQIDDQMPEYVPEHDRMLFHQAFSGSAYTKMSFDEGLGRPYSKFINPLKFVINYGETSLVTSYRYTEIIDINANDLKRSQLDGLYSMAETQEDTDTGFGSLARDRLNKIEGRTKPDNKGDDRQLYEVHTFLALDDSEVDDRTDEEYDIGLELPYIITIDTGSRRILSIRRNWKEGDPRYTKRIWYTHWVFIPGMGFQGYGYIHLIGGLARSATSSLRQLTDSGSFANMQGGFKAHGLRVIGNNEPIAPGEWRDIQAPGMDLDKALKPLPYKEPSQTTLALLDFITKASAKFADSTEQVVSEATNYGPVGTTMALLEAGGRLFSGIHERLYYSQKQELNILMEINAETMPDQYPFDMVGSDKVVARDDFSAAPNVIPATDPREPSAAHRVARANATLTIAGQFPDLHNMPAVIADLHMALGAEDAKKYMKQNQEPKSYDPVTENQVLLNGGAVTTSLGQEHMAHIQVHLHLLEDDKYAQNEQVVKLIMAHIQEHLGDQFRVEVQQAGVELPPASVEEPLPPEIANQIALQAAQAMAQLIPPSEDSIEANKAAIDLELKAAAQALKEKTEEHDQVMDQLKLGQADQHHDEKLALERERLNKTLANQKEIANITKVDQREPERTR